MKSYNLYAVNDLRYEEKSLPQLLPGWCLVKVKAAGICSSDIPRIYKKGTYHFPTIPGHEFSGVVESVADKKNINVVGKKVGVFPLIPCGKCEFCQQKKYEMCINYDYIGSRRDGAFAEYVAVPIWNIVVLDEKVSFVDAAMMEPLAVSLHAINQMSISPSDDIAIVGTGMIAFAAAQWAGARKARSVTVIGRSDSKRTIAESIGGISYFTCYECKDTFNAVLEAVGSNESIEMAINLVKPGGTLVLMGNPQGDIVLSQDTYWRILRKQLTVKGTWNSSYEQGMRCDWEEVKESLTNQTINVKNLVSHVFPQDELRNALELMRDHKEPYCKVMTIWNGE